MFLWESGHISTRFFGISQRPFVFGALLNPLIVQSLVAPFQLSGSRAPGVRARGRKVKRLTEGILLQQPVHSVVLEEVVKFSDGHGIRGKTEEMGGTGAVGATKSRNRPL
jgi:hypothetical protein